MVAIKPEQRAKWVAEFSYLRAEELYILVRKDSINKMTKQERAGIQDAKYDTLCRANLYADPKERAIYVFATEKSFFNGLEEHKRRPHNELTEFSAIITKPLVLLERLTNLSEATMQFEYGSAEAMSFKHKDIASIAESARVLLLAREKSIYVLEDGNKFAMTLDIDEKTYSLGFLSREDGAATLEGVLKEDPGARLAANKTKTLVEGLVNSKLGGLILNPASANEEIISKRTLKKLLLAIETEPRLKQFLSMVAEKIF